MLLSSQQHSVFFRDVCYIKKILDQNPKTHEQLLRLANPYLINVYSYIISGHSVIGIYSYRNCLPT